MTLKLAFSAFLLLAIAGCANPAYITDANSSTVVAEILDQVNGAVEVVKAKYPDAPEISSVQVDLQVGTSASTSIGGPIGLIFPTVSSSKDLMHKMSLTFDTKPVSASTRVTPRPALVSAIEEIYKSVSMANSHFQFQSGSVQLQCTLADGGGVSTGDKGGNGGADNANAGGHGSSGSVQLIPIQFDASSSKQAVHTVTLYFATKKEAPTETKK